MAKILGLDLGTNSIGWALIDNSRKEILNAGVRIFPEGVNDINTSKEKSKNADRRIARGIRRNNYRFKMRRERLKKVLAELGMMPDEKYYTNKKKNKGEKIYLTKELYKLRKDALEIPLRPQDLGRIFLHLNNHRGFMSNKKEEADKEFTNKIKDADKINTLEQKEDTLFVLQKRKEKTLKEIQELKNSLKKGTAKKIKTREKRIRTIDKKINEVNQIKTLQEKIDTAKKEGKIKYGTLGEYFYYRVDLNKDSYNPNHPFLEEDGTGRLRNNDDGQGEYTTREIYEFEFDKIWERQKELNKDNKEICSILSDENKKRIKEECIFYQRDLRSQKYLVDRCKYAFTEYFIYKFDKSDLQNQIDSITYSDCKGTSNYLTEEQKKSLDQHLKKNNEVTVAKIKFLTGLKDNFQNINGKQENMFKINNLPEKRYLEQDYLPCSHISSLEFQEFRIWDKVNNLRYIDEDDVEYALTLEQKQILVQELHNSVSLTIETGNKASDEEKEAVAEIKEVLGLKDNYKFKEQKLKGNVTLTKLKEALGKEYWNSLNPEISEPEIEIVDKSSGEIVKSKMPVQYSNKQRHLYNNIVFSMHFIKSKEWLQGKGNKVKKWKETLLNFGLSDIQLQAYAKVSIEPDYCNYSLRAIKKLLPWMKLGFNSSQAAEKVGYASASDERRNDGYLQERLPQLKNNEIRNPIVQRGVTETIKLINKIIDTELKGNKPDKIHLEMARELKKPKEARQEAKRKNDEKEKERNQWKEFLKQKLGLEPSSNTLLKFEFFLELEHQKVNFEEVKNQISVEEFIKFCKEIMGENISLSQEEFNDLKKKLRKKRTEESEDIDKIDTYPLNEEKNNIDKNNLKLLKYRLYLECNRILPYTGQPISLTRLLKDNSDIEIEHIIPYSRCMDNSFLNKTLSDNAFNAKKGNRTPMEFFESDPQAKKHFISRVNKIKNEQKRKRFLIEGHDELEKFRNSQLINTAYIATEVKKHLLHSFKRDDIIMTNGQITAMLRGFLGFNKALNPPIRIPLDIEKGRYWAVINQNNGIENLFRIRKENGDKKPKPENENWRIVEGYVYESQDGKRFQPKKQRNDHRHHAIDAITVALSSIKITNIIQKNTEGYYVKNGKPIQDYKEGAVWVNKFDENGDFTTETRKKIIDEIKTELNFRGLWWDVKNTVDCIPISYSNKHRITSSGRKWVHKKAKIEGKEVKGFYSGGDVARGSLHEASLYGKTKNLNPDEFVKRINIKDLTWPQIRNIIDSKIRSILIKNVAKYAASKFQEDQIKDSSLSSFQLSFEEIVRLDINETFYREEIKLLKESEVNSNEQKLLLKEYRSKLNEIKNKLKPDKEINKEKKGKKYKDYLQKGFKEAMKAGFFIENEGKRQKRLKKEESIDVERNPVPIKKVRVKYISTSMKEYKTEFYHQKAFVEPGNNYCIVLYGNDVIQNGEKREFKTISFLEVVKKEKRGDPLFPQEYNGKKALTFLSKRDMVLVYKQHPDEVTHLIGKKLEELPQADQELLFKRLFVVRKSDKNGIIVLSRHYLAGAKKEEDISVKDLDSIKGKKLQCNQNTFKGLKVSIDCLGNINVAKKYELNNDDNGIFFNKIKSNLTNKLNK